MAGGLHQLGFLFRRSYSSINPKSSPCFLNASLNHEEVYIFSPLLETNLVGSPTLLVSKIVACETCIPSFCLPSSVPGLTVVTGKAEFRMMKSAVSSEWVRKSLTMVRVAYLFQAALIPPYSVLKAKRDASLRLKRPYGTPFSTAVGRKSLRRQQTGSHYKNTLGKVARHVKMRTLSGGVAPRSV